MAATASDAIAAEFVFDKLKEDHTIAEKFGQLASAEKERLGKLKKGDEPKIREEAIKLLEKCQLPSIKKAMLKVKLLDGIDEDGLASAIEGREELYSLGGKHWAESPEIALDTLAKLSLAEGTTWGDCTHITDGDTDETTINLVANLIAAQVKQVSKKKLKYLFPPFVCFAADGALYKAFLEGDVEAVFPGPSFFKLLAAACNGEMLDKMLKKPGGTDAGPARGTANRSRSVQESVTEDFMQAWNCKTKMDDALAPGAKFAALQKVSCSVGTVKQSELGGAMWRYANVEFGGTTKIAIAPVALLRLPELQKLAGKTSSSTSTYGVDYVYAGLKGADGRKFVARVNSVMKRMGPKRAQLSRRRQPQGP